VPIALKSGSLRLLEPSGPLQACNGIALHFVTLVLLMIVENLSARISVIPRFLNQFSWETVLIVGTQDNTVTEIFVLREEVVLC